MLVPVLNTTVMLLPAETTNGLGLAPVACDIGSELMFQFLPSYICQTRYQGPDLQRSFEMIIKLEIIVG